jgi:hypothetical protein
MSRRRKPIRVKIRVVDGGYTGGFYLGSRRELVHLLLDTGSSKFAVDSRFYDALKDSRAKATRLVQEGYYADQSGWRGSVVETDLAAATGKGRSFDLLSVPLAVANKAWKGMFDDSSQGILGLAYRSLDDAIELARKTLPPRYSGQDLRKGRKAFVIPFFQQLEDCGLAAGKFAFQTRRFTARVSPGGEKLDDPENHGILVLGGGEEETDLYRGSFQTAKILSDDYWSVNLKQVFVGSKPAIHVPPPALARESATNAIVDSGTPCLALSNPLYGKLLGCLTREQRKLVRKGVAALSDLRLASWPTLSFVLEGQDGKDVTLRIPPEVYWQADSDSAGRAACGLSYMSGDMILGLPLMNAYYTIFDGLANHGMGVVKFAKHRFAA